MRVVRRLLGGVVVLAIAAGIAAPARATTLIRQSLDDLVAKNGTIVLGEVVGAHSYWNADGTFILTDVRLAAQEILKGDPGTRELTVTVMGGTVGDLSTLILAGAELVRGKSYLLFLDQGDLPGAKGVRTVRHHSQGVFEIELAADGMRAISQASRHGMAPDRRGEIEPPGGTQGVPLGTMVRSIRSLVERPQGSRREVQ